MPVVLDSVTGRVKPGRMEDHLAMAVEVTKLFERLGAKNARLAMAVATGEPSGTFTYSTEYDSSEAWGEMADTMNGDAEFQAFMTRVNAPDAPSELLQLINASEISLGDHDTTLGNVLSVHVQRPVPGRFEQALEQTARVRDLVEARGATNCRLWQLGYAGLGAALQMLSFEYPDMKTCGRIGDMWNTDPEMIEVGMLRFSDAPTMTPVFDGLYQVVPI